MPHSQLLLLQTPQTLHFLQHMGTVVQSMNEGTTAALYQLLEYVRVPKVCNLSPLLVGGRTGGEGEEAAAST